jgi:sulfatase modifying factor 1
MAPSWWRGLPALAIAIFFGSCTPAYSAESPEMAILPGGKFLRFFVPRRSSKQGNQESAKRLPIVLPTFLMDRLPVTNSDYFRFVQANPKWAKSSIAPIFADPSYLKHWSSNASFGPPENGNRPVTHVSWFAAKAFCQWQGKALPSTDQWEYAAQNRNQDLDGIRKRILAWYSKPNSDVLPEVGVSAPNSYGIHDLHGVIWEWTSDFSSTMIGAEIRDSGVNDDNLFCGAGSLGALDPSDYATFMRFSFRASLSAAFTTANLGFRCAKELEK